MKKKEEKKNTSKKQLNWIDDQFAVSGVKNYSDNCTFFNLYVKSAVGNVAIYGCKVITGEKGYFIAYPSTPYDSNGETKYREHASIIFNDEMQNKIIDAVADQI